MNTPVWDRLDPETRAKLREQFPEMEKVKRRRRRRRRNRNDIHLRDKTRDMTITIHALERMEERWPQLCEGLNDEEIARVIQGEVNDALVQGRHGQYCPLELANKSVERWRARAGGQYCWTKDKSRGYACRESKENGLIVMTTLVADGEQDTREKLIRKR